MHFVLCCSVLVIFVSQDVLTKLVMRITDIETAADSAPPESEACSRKRDIQTFTRLKGLLMYVDNTNSYWNIVKFVSNAAQCLRS